MTYFNSLTRTRQLDPLQRINSLVVQRSFYTVQFWGQFQSFARKIVRKVASNSENPNRLMLDFHCKVCKGCAQLFRPLRARLLLREAVTRSLAVPTIDYIAEPYLYTKFIGKHRKKLEFSLVFVVYLIN